MSKLMNVYGLQACGKRKFKATSNSSHRLPVLPDLLESDFHVAVPDHVWTGDITYSWTDDGWLYFVVIVNVFRRQVVGSAMRERMTRKLDVDALRMDWFRRWHVAGLIFHSDCDSQYATSDLQKQL